MKVILIRHAKSDWGQADLHDHDRPLNARGRRAAPRIGAWLAAGGHVPDQVLCSTARRTQETWAGIADMLPGPPRPVLMRSLYHAVPDELWSALRAAKGTTVAMIAHNPGIGDCAAALANAAPDHPDFARYPTGATTVLQFDGPLMPHQGAVIGFVVPRELSDPP